LYYFLYYDGLFYSWGYTCFDYDGFLCLFYSWGYTCFDLSNVNKQAVKDDPKARLARLYINRYAQIRNFYLDEVNIAGSTTVKLNLDNKLEDGNSKICYHLTLTSKNRQNISTKIMSKGDNSNLI